MSQNFLCPQRDQPLLMPVDMREWLPEDDLVFIVLDAVATLDLGEFRRRYRADGHGRAAFDPEMMVALLLYGYCQGERSSRVIEKRCVRDVAYRGSPAAAPDHATIARFRAQHQTALGGLFSQVLRLLAAEGMVSLGVLSLDGTKLAGNAAQKANRTLPQIEKLLAEAAAADAAEDARYGDAAGALTPRALARRAGRRAQLARARDGLAAEDKARRDAQRARQEPGTRPRRPGKQRGRRPADEPPRQPGRHRAAGEHHRPGRAGDAEPERLRGGYNGQPVVTAQQVIVGAMLSQHPVGRTLLHPLLDSAGRNWLRLGSSRSCALCSPTLATSQKRISPVPSSRNYGCWRRSARTLARTAPAPHSVPGTSIGSRPPRAPVRRLRHHRGRADYKLRAQTVEAVFGQIKTCMKMTTMSRRSFAACHSEWLLAATAHNLRKLHRHRAEG